MEDGGRGRISRLARPLLRSQNLGKDEAGDKEREAPRGRERPGGDKERDPACLRSRRASQPRLEVQNL